MVFAAAGGAIGGQTRLGKAIVGRGAVNQKGPEAAFLAALHAIRGAGRRCRSTWCWWRKAKKKSARRTFGQIVHRPEVQAALRNAVGVFMPSPPRIWMAS